MEDFRGPSRELVGSLKKSWVELESESATAVLSWLRSMGGRRREREPEGEPGSSPTLAELPKALHIPLLGRGTTLSANGLEHSQPNTAEPSHSVLEGPGSFAKGTDFHRPPSWGFPKQ